MCGRRNKAEPRPRPNLSSWMRCGSNGRGPRNLRCQSIKWPGRSEKSQNLRVGQVRPQGWAGRAAPCGSMRAPSVGIAEVVVQENRGKEASDEEEEGKL